MAAAAEAADDLPQASMISAPLFATFSMNSPWIYSYIPSRDFPLTLVKDASGYCVAEWLPQIIISSMFSIGAPVFLLI